MPAVRPIAALCALACSLPAADAARAAGPCFPGHDGDPCRFAKAKVIGVPDGDTIRVRRGGREQLVRLRGVQAMELTRYRRRHRRGACHAVEATERLESIVRGRRVRLSSQRSRSDGRRVIRWVAVRRGGEWRDVGEVLMREGHGLWLASPGDTAFNQRYNLARHEAAAAGRGLFDTDRCGRGPQQEAPIDVWVLSDPAGVDTADGEFVAVRNRGAAPLDLGGWWLRDAHHERFVLPSGTRLAPGATLTLWVGSVPESPGVFSWGMRAPIFANAIRVDVATGDGAYLFDPDGDLRAWMLYPCVGPCGDPLQGTVAVAALPRTPERVVVTNTGAAAISLHGYALYIRGSTYAFGDPTTLAPGERVTVHIGGDPSRDSASTRHWGLDGNRLPDAGGYARLMTFSHITLDCDAWGSGRC